MKGDNVANDHQEYRFGPANAEEQRIFAEEEFRIDIQLAIHDLMQARGINQKCLAEALGISEARVSQYFSDRCNMTVRTIAAVFHALGAKAVISAVRPVVGPLGREGQLEPAAAPCPPEAPSRSGVAPALDARLGVTF